MCDFASDPRIPHEEQSLFWLPSLQPQVVRLVPANADDELTIAPIDLAQIKGFELRRADDGWHGLWRSGDVTHQVWLRDSSPEETTPYAVTLPFDGFFELRAHAARRFWRALNGRPPGPIFRAMPEQLRHYHILCLRALDAKLGGASYRTIAEGLLGFSGTKEDWEIDPRKNKSRRMVAKGMQMMGGGYKSLLHYPIKPLS